MGPSGSGKSTLMHILAGLDKPTEGTVEIDGIEITALGDNELTRLRRQKIGFIFQFFNLLPMLTAEENIVLPARIAGEMPETRVARRADRAGRAQRPGRPPPERDVGRPAAAGGDRPRAGHPARRSSSPTSRPATSTRPPAARSSSCCASSVDDYDQTTVMVTHDAKAAAIADRVLFLADGVICRELGRADEREILETLATLGD